LWAFHKKETICAFLPIKGKPRKWGKSSFLINGSNSLFVQSLLIKKGFGQQQPNMGTMRMQWAVMGWECKWHGME
jgi:hypothetical protein